MPYPQSVTNAKAAGRLKDGDELFTLKVPELEGKYRYEKYWIRVMPSGQAVLVMSVAPQNAGATGPGEYNAPAIRQIEYLANHAGWATYDAANFCKKLVESNIFAKENQLTGMYTVGSQFPTAATQALTDYVIDGDGVVTKDPKPASGTDVKEAQDKNNQLLTQLTQTLTGGSTTTSGTSSATGTQKIVRILLIGVAAVGAIFVTLKVFGKKKK